MNDPTLFVFPLPDIVHHTVAAKTLPQCPLVPHGIAPRIAIEMYEGSHKAVVSPALRLQVGNLQPAGSYSACIRAVAPCGYESQRSPWSVAPAWYPSYLQPQGWTPTI